MYSKTMFKVNVSNFGKDACILRFPKEESR
jgi:hypothetical protein